MGRQRRLKLNNGEGDRLQISHNVTFHWPQVEMNYEIMNKVIYVHCVSLLAQHNCVIQHCSRVFIQWAGNVTHATGTYRMYFAGQFVFVHCFLFSSFLLIFSAAALFPPSISSRSCGSGSIRLLKQTVACKRLHLPGLIAFRHPTTAL